MVITKGGTTMSRYKITVKDYFSSAEREFKTCQVLEEYLPEDFAQADVLLHLRRAIEMMLKALYQLIKLA